MISLRLSTLEDGTLDKLRRLRTNLLTRMTSRLLFKGEYVHIKVNEMKIEQETHGDRNEFTISRINAG